MAHKSRRALSCAAALGLFFGVTGCEDMTALVTGSRVAPDTHVASAPLRLQAGDTVKLVVIGDDKLSSDYQIDAQGQIDVPAAGAVRAVGLTTNQLADKVADRLRERQYLVAPMVTASVASFRPFYVLGEVGRPGEYPYRTGLNLMSAIAVAGGETYRASTSTALIQRAGDSEFREAPLSPSVPIYPGDLIKLPERYF